MHGLEDSLLARLLHDLLGDERSRLSFAQLEVHRGLHDGLPNSVPRGLIAHALNMALFADLLERVPMARARVNEVVAEGGRVMFDHGALRTVVTPFPNPVPSGFVAFARILEPLGYEMTQVYPLERLSMTGRSFTHRDHPEHIAQFFVSELHLERFSPGFQSAAQNVLAKARDPLPHEAAELLARLTADHALPFSDALRLLRALLPCFGRQHDVPAFADYETLLSESAEMAWIATEGHTFNHVTERVANLDAVSLAQRQLGRPMKDRIEVSRSGRVRQTAYFADPVQREFIAADGSRISKQVPGSFYEFIQRSALPATGGVRRLDLGFDSGNAQGIFKMTAAA